MTGRFLALAIVLVAPALTGCGTLLNGRYQNIPIYSTPSGAEIEIDGRVIGTTPAAFNFRRGRTYIVVLRKDGYEQTMALIRRRVDALPFVLNLGVPFYIGYGVDFTNGAGFMLRPRRLDVTLLPSTNTEASSSEAGLFPR
ncbi:MAG: PEGA domain-containing protein [Bacteroidota bacterium]